MHTNEISNIKRPKILIKAAQIGQRHYQRGSNLKNILGCTKLPNPNAILTRLCEKEQALNEARLLGEASYSITRHITLLTALLEESKFVDP